MYVTKKSATNHNFKHNITVGYLQSLVAVEFRTTGNTNPVAERKYESGWASLPP